ncbi:dynamin family protein [filamentous cyanobacterium LEGE 11480]|uniref:Dynamin family protein n=1 Tax=Romeriopsis navalis LEGE 11480 TaxID=2777977 RepID=A0A928VPK0_9CYAN|nr:dynamin family protein [Romeriopsis navalis]MBE9032428.1 dynamin family protein [Romeriopsis navalis LEGE 11480]
MLISARLIVTSSKLTLPQSVISLAAIGKGFSDAPAYCLNYVLTDLMGTRIISYDSSKSQQYARKTAMNFVNFNQSNDLNERIDAVIQKRQSLARRIQPVYEHLDQMLQQITNLSQKQQAFQGSLDQVPLKETLGKLNVTHLENQIRTERDRLSNLIARLSRPTLNVGVVGRMRQGKSTFLQQLSGLTDDEIPARKGGACTAVRSKIYHHDGPTEASVTFHSETSFLQEVIRPYYEELGFANPPASLDIFESSALPMKPGGAALGTMYEHLKHDYQENLKAYRPRLLDSSPRVVRIPQNKIPDYVSQQRDTQHRLTSHFHLGVKEVSIHCRFQKAGVYKLGLVDVPGLGDTRLGDSQLILETLGREVDAVIFIRRPDPLGYQWDNADLALYDLALKALPNTAQRSFMLLNHQQVADGGNLEACQTLQRSLSKIKVAECVIADCSDANASHQVLEQVLQYLDREIIKLEENQAKSCQLSLVDLHRTLKSELEQGSAIASAPNQERQLFIQLFRQFRHDLSNGLRDLAEELEQKQEVEDTNFQVAVKSALQQCQKETGVPLAIDIKKRCRSDFHDSYKATYCIYVAELRSDLSRKFLTIEEGLKQAAHELKERIAQTLIERAGMGAITSARGAEFLNEMTQLLEARSNRLHTGFAMLSDFNVSYGEVILNDIRKKLMEVLDPDDVVVCHELSKQAVKAVSSVSTLSTQALGQTVHLDNDLVRDAAISVEQLAATATDALFELNAESVNNKLKRLHQQAVNQCEQALQHWLSMPSQIHYSMTTEFIDRVLDEENIIDEWELLLGEQSIRNQLWQEFTEIEQIQRIQSAWLKEIQMVQEANQRNRIEFLD